MAPTADDVPERFDCLIDGQGYVFVDTQIRGLGQEVRAEYALTPTFVPRQNVQGDFGDNQQDFWLTFTQKDWSLGEQQRYFRQADADSERRYWQGTNVDVAEPGRVKLRPLTAQTAAFGAAIQELVGDGLTSLIYGASAANLYEMNAAGTITSRGAHGLGTIPLALCIGGEPGVYLSSNDTSTVGIRLWNGSAFSTFSAVGADSLAFVNNTLYGISRNIATGTNYTFKRWDSGGTVNDLFTWKNASGAGVGILLKIIPFGGDVLILRASGDNGLELWLYNGVAPAIIASFGMGLMSFSVTHTLVDLAVVQGTVFISCLQEKQLSSVSYVRPVIFYYSNGTIGKLWQADSYVAVTAARESRLVAFAGGLVFTDDTTGRFMFYDPGSGGISAIGGYTFTDNLPRLATTRNFFLHSREATTPYRFPSDGYATTATITTSLDDFDSSLNKLFRGISVDFDSAADGDGGSVDVAYRVGDVDGSYTNLQTAAASGTEYLLSGVTGRSISVKVTLNKGTSTAGPVLKRISLRAAPIQPQFPRATYSLDCTGTSRSPASLVTLRDGQQHGKTGLEMVADLKAAAAKTAPITIVDTVNGSFAGIIESDSLRIESVRRGEEFIVSVSVRGV